MENSHIGWTDHTFNPWEGCVRVSEGCRFCYAEARDLRFTGGAHWGADATRRVTSDSNWRKPLKWNRDAIAAGRPALVFCASLADVFEDRHDLDEPRARLFELIEATPGLRWLLLTKRPENIAKLVPEHWWDTPSNTDAGASFPSHVWLGTTVENQHRADERIPTLMELPATVRFLSAEPLLGPLALSKYLEPVDGVDWVITGGESGRQARPMEVNWPLSIVSQCRLSDVPVFVKQMGSSFGPDHADPDTFPAGLRYQEWPADAGDRSGTPVPLPQGAFEL